LREGQAKLVIKAVDTSLLKNETNLVKDVYIDLSPPSLSILSSPAKNRSKCWRFKI